MSKEIQHISGSAGGFLVGNSHKNGGIKAINKATGQPLEMEGGEVVITKPAVEDQTKYEFEGEMLTNRQILSKINESGGGVSFADGGEIPEELYFYGNSYQFGGETLTDYQIAQKISSCGCGCTLEGGLSENKSIEDIAKMHNVSVDLIKNQLEKGIEVEFEHTNDKNLSKRIAMDHLVEHANYYDVLEEAKLKDGGEIDSNNELNMNPFDTEELKESLQYVLNNLNEDKSLLLNIQTNYFENIVVPNIKEKLSGYYEAINILPKSKRGYFQYEFLNHYNFDLASKLDDNPFNYIPENIKSIRKIKKLDFSPTPDSDNLGKITDLFVARDELRPIMSGVYFNLEDERIEATNAHVLLFIKEKPHISKSSICLMGKTKEWYLKGAGEHGPKENKDGCWEIDAKYMNTSAILPNQFEYVITVNANSLLEYAKSAYIFASKETQSILLSFREEENNTIITRSFNYSYLESALKGMLMLGYDEVDFCFQMASNRAVCVVPKGNSRKISYNGVNTDLVLLMPLFLSEVNDYDFVYDIENSKAYVYHKFKNLIDKKDNFEKETEPDLPLLPQQKENNTPDEEKQEILDAIEGLKVILNVTPEGEEEEIIDAILGLKLILDGEEDSKFEKGGIISKDMIQEKFNEGYGKVKVFELSDILGGKWVYHKNPTMTQSQIKKSPIYTFETTEQQKQNVQSLRDKYESFKPKEITISEFANSFAKENGFKKTYTSPSGSVYLETPDKKTIRISDHYILDRDVMNPKARYDFEIIRRSFDETDSINFNDYLEKGGKVSSNDNSIIDLQKMPPQPIDLPL